MNEKFTASALRSLLPDQVILDEKGVTFKVRKLIGGKENFVFYSDIAGVDIDNGLFFSNIMVKARAREQEIVINNFSKGDARKIKDLILERAHN